MKRGPPPPPSIPKVQSDRMFLADPNPTFSPDPKEILQKKLQTQDYNPFGRAGGGAPNPKHEQNVTVNTEGNYSGMAMGIRKLDLIKNKSINQDKFLSKSTTGKNTYQYSKNILWGQTLHMRFLKTVIAHNSSSRFIKNKLQIINKDHRIKNITRLMQR